MCNKYKCNNLIIYYNFNNNIAPWNVFSPSPQKYSVLISTFMDSISIF